MIVCCLTSQQHPVRPVECLLFCFAFWLVKLDQEQSPRRRRESNPWSVALEADALTTRPVRQWVNDRIQRRYSRILQSPHSAANCLQHARSSGPGAIVCKSRAIHLALFTCRCHVTCHLVRRDSSAIKFDRVKIAYI